MRGGVIVLVAACLLLPGLRSQERAQANVADVTATSITGSEYASSRSSLPNFDLVSEPLNRDMPRQRTVVATALPKNGTTADCLGNDRPCHWFSHSCLAAARRLSKIQARQSFRIVAGPGPNWRIRLTEAEGEQPPRSLSK